MVRKDISVRKDVESLVNAFYSKVRENEVIGPIFNDIAKVNWQEHLPKMYSFWSSILLGEQSYAGNPMITHVNLSRNAEMEEREFNEWIRLFNSTVDELYEGPVADEAKTRAANIARLMLFKIRSKQA